MALHPAENRGYRELYVSARQLADHWTALQERLGGPPAGPVFGRAAAAARELIEELEPVTARHGLHGFPAADGLGASLARSRSHTRDRFLEKNQAARFALGDIQHVVTLLAYLSRVSQTSGNDDLAEFSRRWSERLRRVENHARRAVVQLGDSLDDSVEPLDGSPAGRTATTLGNAVGTVGEWVDRQASKLR